VPTANLSTAQLQAVQAQVGAQIFADNNLSEPQGTPCLACHRPDMGFAGNHGGRNGVAVGSLPNSVGLRNTMTNSYASFVPTFSFQTTNGETEAVGGLFWDGRADTPALQALGPFLNGLEMNNASKAAVVQKISTSNYAPLFRQAFGDTVFNNTETAYTNIGIAIAAFEVAQRQDFSSKFDAMVQGKATFTPAESRGMALFQDANKGNCAACHLMNATSGKPSDSLFSEFTYYATGIPRNSAIPNNSDPAFYDLGLCGPNRTPPTLPTNVAPGVTIDNFCGKFRMPTLRNVAQRPAFMHNGFFKDLNEVVRFYATRNSDPQRWYGPSGVMNDLPAKYLGNIETTKAPFNRAARQGPALNDAEINDIVAFLRTLTDGYLP
jgi:cytochrome c peroxidase